MNIRTILFAISVAVLLAGCKIQFAALDGGEIYAQTEGFVCSEFRKCTANVVDTSFNESFLARPKEGYAFDGWVNGTDYFCGGKRGSCDLSTTGFEGNTALLDVIDSDKEFYLVARFKPECYTGESELGGMYREPLRLCREGSPYTVTADIQLGPEAPFFVDPGVTLASTSPTGNTLVSYSNVYLLGKPQKKVRIRDINIATNYSGQTSTIDINHTIMTFPRTKELSTPSLDMVFTEAGGYARITDSEIHAGVFFNADSNSRVISTVTTGKAPIVATRIERNTFVDGGLLLLVDKDIFIRNNLWLGESTEIIIRRAGASKVVANYNSFLATTPQLGGISLGGQWTNSVIVEPRSTGQNIDLKSNFWGTTNRTKIADEIWDANDTFEVDVTASFRPILGKPHPKTPTTSG